MIFFLLEVSFTPKVGLKPYTKATRTNTSTILYNYDIIEELLALNVSSGLRK